jgi:Cdc6-like AAA superfamily ATPase
MITDARALQNRYVPQDMAHRDGAIDHLAATLDPPVSENVSIFGPSGSGKTTLAKYVLGRLKRDRLEYRWGYHNCMSESSKAGALHSLVRDAGLGRDLRRTGTPTGVYIDRISEREDPMALVLDEIDMLDDPTLLVTLAGLRDVSLVTICVDRDRLHTDLRADGRVRSRLRSAETVRLDRYAQAELVDIVQYRVDHGLNSGLVADGAVAAIADLAAGDAREALSLLRHGAQHVRQGHAGELTVEVVHEVASEAREGVRERRIRYLGTHKRALYEIVRGAGADGISASELHERYAERVQEPKTKRTRRRYLDRLEEYDLIESEGPSRARRYYIR